MNFSRHWAMPSPDTFSIPPVAEFVRRWMDMTPGESLDPFARDCTLATYRNDLNPATAATHHMDAADFCIKMAADGVRCSLALFDPPYSPRQISECYASFGRAATGQDTQNAALYRRVRDAMMPCLRPGAVVLSFGWNSAGMGKRRGFEIVELMLVARGGAHNDTICIAERSFTQPTP